MLLLLRRTYTLGENGFTMTAEMSRDMGATWTPSVVRRYTRREPSEDFFEVRDDAGLPAPGRAPEAAEFDFLLGEFEATHWLATPRGPIGWRSNATAVHALDGHVDRVIGAPIDVGSQPDSRVATAGVSEPRIAID